LNGFNWSAGIVCGVGLVLAIIGWVYMPERRNRLTPQGRRENRTGYGFMAPGLIGLAVFSIGPMILSLLMSFADWDIITPAHWRGAGNFVEAFFQDSRFWKCLAVTGIYTVLAVPLGVVMNLVLALLLNLKVRGIAFFRTCFYMPALASTVASSLIWKKIFQQDGGLANAVIYGQDGKVNLLGLGHLFSNIAGTPGQAPNWLANEKLALPSIAFMSLWAAGGGMIILLAGLQGVPQFYYEAATLDGANAWQRFWHVTLPLIAPSLFFVLVTGVIGSFQTFTQAFVITQGGPNDTTRFYMYHLYDQAFRNLRMGYASALAWILFFIILAVTVLQFRLSRNIHYEANLR
jgi:multiple sugar transport system permease protein